MNRLTKEERAERQATVMRLRASGLTFRAIARATKLDVKMVHKHYKESIAIFVQERQEMTEKYMAQNLEALRILTEESLKEYEKSKKPRKKKHSKSGVNQFGSFNEEGQSEVTQIGSTAHLDVAYKCIQETNRMLRVYELEPVTTGDTKYRPKGIDIQINLKGVDNADDFDKKPTE